MTAHPAVAYRGGVVAELWADDSRLVKECLRGEEAAWAALVAKYKNLIFSIPIKYGFNQEEAADVFQAVCLDMVSQLTTLREPRALAGWLIRVTHNKCFHQKEQSQRYPAREETEQDPAGPPQELPENRLHELQREQILRDAIGALSPRCRQLVKMLFFESPVRPYQEIAKLLGLATGSIGFIRGRCLGKLRKQLEEVGLAWTNI
jgi:RNA polymerase sigma factor (sigma-70 family)